MNPMTNNPEVTVSKKQMERAFAEWERRYREEPKRFETDVERVLAGGTPENYGEACAPYFMELLAEVK